MLLEGVRQAVPNGLRRALLAGLVAGAALHGQGQDTLAARPPSGAPDTLVMELGSVVILPDAGGAEEHKPLSGLDQYLERSSEVNMLRRGAYAWEPLLNGMATERSVITIDGMRVYAACTDKMDPVTSYVETSNLSRARIKNGSSGAAHGATIAGSIDLERRKAGFAHHPAWAGSFFAGFEGNNSERIAGTALSYADSLFYTNLDATFRKASNYKAGRLEGSSREVEFSQFAKYNLSAIAGYRLGAGREVEASLIYDRATDVGYPGLPMDVALARAVMGSLQYRYLPRNGAVSLWETKVYYNTITHIMDDSRRPAVPVRMDMPGWSSTAGMYSKVYLRRGKHRSSITFSAHGNSSLAEMTMYPSNPREQHMFMLTWPDVRTLYGGLHAEDRVDLRPGLELSVHAGAGVQEHRVESEFGMRSLELFYPEVAASQLRLLPSAGGKLTLTKGAFTHQAGLGFSQRAPSVSEGYGFYLFNANDNFDYVGNPGLRNESALSVEVAGTCKQHRLELEWKALFMHLTDYIIGVPSPDVAPMNMTASGIKVYEQLPHAAMLNTALAAQYSIREPWRLRVEASYRYGQGSDGTALPLIQPLQYAAQLRFRNKAFTAEAMLHGSTANRHSPAYGETGRPAYAVADLALGRDLGLGKHKLTVKLGVDNLLDAHYTTFSDWFGIPRPGRNCYGHLIFTL